MIDVGKPFTKYGTANLIEVDHVGIRQENTRLVNNIEGRPIVLLI